MSFADVESGNRRGAKWGGYQDTGRRAGGESDQLIQLISNNIKQINYNVSQITKMVNVMGVPNKDSHELRVQLRDIIDATRKMALETNKSLKDLSQLPGADPQESRKQQTKLKTDFQSCLERFQAISKTAGKKASSSVPPKPFQTQQPTLAGATPWHEEDEEDEQQSLIEAQKRQQLQQLDSDSEFQTAIISEREEGIKEIERSIQEVNDIFVDLATLVNEQAPMIDNIESHIDSAVYATGKGVVELRKASEYQDSARTKMCCIIVIILIIVAIVVLALVLGISFGIKK